MERATNAPRYISKWFPKFIRNYNIEEAFNAEIAALSIKLCVNELSMLKDLKEQYLKINGGRSIAIKEKIANIERAVITIIGEKGLERIKQRQILPPLPFHGLRHSAATMLINQGLPAKSISGRLGHANISTTMDIYGHYLKSADKEAADRLKQVYQNIKSNGKKDTKKGQA